MAVHALSRKTSCPLRFSRACKSFSTLEGGRLSVGSIARALARARASVLLPIDLPGIRFASTHTERLRKMVALAPVPDLKALAAVEDKWSQARFLIEHDLPHPPTLLASADEDLAGSLRDFPFPALVKPLTGSYGRGIRAFADRDSLLRFLQTGSGAQEQYVVQAYIGGKDIDCSVLCEEGEILAYTIQEGFIPAPRPFHPAGGISFVEDDRVLDVVGRLMRLLRWNGIAHVDLRYDSQGPLVLEINPRFWGSVLGSLVAGVNFPQLACLAGLGIRFPRPDCQHTKFVAGATAVRHWLCQPWRGLATGFSFGQTSLRFALADPGPEFFEAIKCLLATVGAKKKLNEGEESVGLRELVKLSEASPEGNPGTFAA
jgi:glutathione synthase/RimK-type ligase-like ATP-grasp enzyme